MQELRDQLKQTQSFKDFGYVLKQDLINVYLKKRRARHGESEDSDDDVLLLI